VRSLAPPNDSRRAPILLTANELDFHRYAEQSRIGSEVEFGKAGFSGLVRWSTEQLVGPPAATALALERVEDV
jgi:hypothetical protein